MIRIAAVGNMRFNPNSSKEDPLVQPFQKIILEKESDTDFMWALWKELFLGVLDKHTSVQSVRKKKSSVPWLTGEI